MIKSEPKEMRPMTAETNDPIKEKKRAEYLVNILLLDDSKFVKVPPIKLYEIVECFVSDDRIFGLVISKLNYKTTTVKID